jgi:hypothetical protein
MDKQTRDARRLQEEGAMCKGTLLKQKTKAKDKAVQRITGHQNIGPSNSCTMVGLVGGVLIPTEQGPAAAHMTGRMTHCFELNVTM